LDYEPSQIVVSNGAKHSLMNAFTAICNPGDEVLLPAPYWVSYEEMIKLADGVPVVLNTTEENGFKFTAEALDAAIGPKTRALVLNSPSNPTGMVYTRAELEQIAAVAVKRGIYVISDEVYEHLIYEGEHVSIASLGEEIKRLTVLINGVSKTYAMTGWRIGYCASEKALAAAMGNIQSHATSNPNSIAQAAALAALSSEDGKAEIAAMKRAFAQRREYMTKRINAIEGVSCPVPQGAFYVMMNISKLKGKTFAGRVIRTSDDLADALLDEAKLALVPCSGFGADDYMRWSYAASLETIQDGLARLENFLKNA
jgi:aspartate aminotransferase